MMKQMSAKAAQQKSPDTGALLKRPCSCDKEGAKCNGCGSEAQAKGDKKPSCGPDVTGWFKNTMESAKNDSGILVAKKALEIAQRAGKLIGIDAGEVVEGGLKVAVSALGAFHGTPPPEAKRELKAADRGHNLPKTLAAMVTVKP